jgi:hypothetical protein
MTRERSLLQALEPELREALGDERVTKAIRKKRLDARDDLLIHISSSRDLRGRLRERHSGFDCVTRYVAALATLEPWPFH